jgi:hypothetical protein
MLVISADNIYSDIDIAKLAKTANSVLIYKQNLALLLQSPLLSYSDSILLTHIENPHPNSRYINTGAYSFSNQILEEEPVFLT